MTTENNAAVMAAIQKSNPTMGNVHIDAPLANMSVAYMQQADDMIAGKWFPNVLVPKRSDLYFKYNKESWFRAQAQKRAPGAQTAGGEFELTTGSYSCEIWGVHKDTPNPVRNNQDAPLDLDRDAAQWCAQQIMLAAEKNLASTAFTTGVWGQDWTGAGSEDLSAYQLKYWDASGATPIKDIKRILSAIRRSTGRRPNTMVINAQVRDVLLTASDVVARVLYNPASGVANVNEQVLAAVIGVDRVLVAQASENTAKRDTAAVMADLYSDSCWVGYVNPSPSINAPSAGYSFVWKDLDGAVEGFQSKRILLDREDSVRIESQYAFDHKVVAPDCGQFISAILTPP